MKTLKYKVIKSEKQYLEYCNMLENILITTPDNSDEIELLTLLIEKWDEEHFSNQSNDPVEIIKSLMEENNLKSKDLAEILGLSKSTVSKILNYHKGISKETIRKLSDFFKVSQQAFNRPYKLINSSKKNHSNSFHTASRKKTNNAFVQ